MELFRRAIEPQPEMNKTVTKITDIEGGFIDQNGNQFSIPIRVHAELIDGVWMWVGEIAQLQTTGEVKTP